LREELGATYYLSVDLSLFTNRGYLFIQTGADFSRLREIVSSIKQELTQLKSNQIDSVELDKTKTILKNQLLMTTETSDAIARFFGETFLFERKLVTVKEVLRKIQQVDLRALGREINQWLRTDRAHLVMILPQPLDFSVKKIFQSA
jgi:predicted Zn-dependent peptidase